MTESISAAKTIAACLHQAKALNTSSDSARLDVEVLLVHVLKKNRTYLYTWPEKSLSDAEYLEFNSLVARRVNGEPIAYITGSRAFWTLELQVNSSTLIPRPDTELLVETALEYCFADAHVLDLGTGTGAIALALASEIPSMCVEAVDFSADAVKLAEENRQINTISNAKIYRSNWFESVEGYFDVIVSNPPYIEKNDPHLMQGDVRFEPASALVSGDDGLDDIRVICSQSHKHMHENAWLIIEHGYMQGDAVNLVFLKNKFKNIRTVKDYSGRDRVTLGQMHTE